MRVVAVDDEQISLMYLETVLRNTPEIEEVSSFSCAEDAIAFFQDNTADAAFLDIQLYLAGSSLNGIMLAAKIREMCPTCHIVFVTSCPEYAVDAFKLHASGYIIKPVTQEAIKKELDYIIRENTLAAMNAMPEPIPQDKLRVQCFGNFEVFYNGAPVNFQLTKAKELFAYLVHRKGASVSVGELAATLFENREDSESVQSQIRNMISSMRKTFIAIGCPDLFNKTRGYISVITENLDCDYYDFMNGVPEAINSYTGEYMAQYSWAEFTIGYLENAINR